MNAIHATAVVYPGVQIGDRVYIGPGCIIGAPPEIRGFFGSGEGVIIKNGTRLEKNVVVDAGSNGPTVIGENCMLMSGVHIGHDSILEQEVTISAGATFAGHVRICKNAYIGVNAIIHQFQVVGAYAILGMGAVLTKRKINTLVMPCTKWVGNPAREIGRNTVGMDRAGLTEEDAHRLTTEYLDTFPLTIARI